MNVRTKRCWHTFRKLQIRGKSPPPSCFSSTILKRLKVSSGQDTLCKSNQFVKFQAVAMQQNYRRYLAGAAKIVMRRPVASIPSKRMNVIHYCYYYGLVILSNRKWPCTSRRSNSRSCRLLLLLGFHQLVQKRTC